MKVQGAVVEHGPVDVESAAGQGEHRLNVSFPFGAFAVKEAPAPVVKHIGWTFRRPVKPSGSVTPTQRPGRIRYC